MPLVLPGILRQLDRARQGWARRARRSSGCGSATRTTCGIGELVRVRVPGSQAGPPVARDPTRRGVPRDNPVARCRPESGPRVPGRGARDHRCRRRPHPERGSWRVKPTSPALPASDTYQEGHIGGRAVRLRASRCDEVRATQERGYTADNDGEWTASGTMPAPRAWDADRPSTGDAVWVPSPLLPSTSRPPGAAGRTRGGSSQAQEAWRRRRVNTPPMTTAPRPTTASSP